MLKCIEIQCFPAWCITTYRWCLQQYNIELKQATFLSHGRKPEANFSPSKTVVSPRFSYYSSLLVKRFLTIQMRQCEDNLKSKTAHSQLPSAAQKGRVLKLPIELTHADVLKQTLVEWILQKYTATFPFSVLWPTLHINLPKKYFVYRQMDSSTSFEETSIPRDP